MYVPACPAINGVNVQSPVASSEVFCTPELQEITGEIVSSTVTVATHDAVFPLPSSTVNVTGFAPILVHVNAVVEAVNERIPQLSEDPPSMSDATMEALPVPSRYKLMF